MRTFKEAFGLRLKEIRKSRKYTQEQLAELIGLNQRQLTRIESGENFPSSDTLERLCVAIDVHPQLLFEYEWEYKAVYERTGTENRPMLRVLQRGDSATVKSNSGEVMRELKENRQFHIKDAEKSMVETAKKLNKPINVEHFNEKGRVHIKTYYPDGTTEVLFTEKEVLTGNLRFKTNDRLKKMDMKQLQFVNLSMDALHDKASLKKLQSIMKGIELMLD